MNTTLNGPDRTPLCYSLAKPEPSAGPLRSRRGLPLQVDEFPEGESRHRRPVGHIGAARRHPRWTPLSLDPV
jgi:hypothetical protein